MGEDTTLEKLVQTGFKPSEHGFRFANNFPGYIMGAVCGGMSFTAEDLFRLGRKVPLRKDIPERDSPAYHYFLKRQLDSFGPFALYGAKLVQWMLCDNEDVWKRTHGEFRDVREILDTGELAQLYLVYKDASKGLNPVGNHQVLAYGYSQFSDGSYHLHICDPNHSCDDNDVIVLEPTDCGGSPGLRCGQQWRKGTKNVRGFFINRHYTQKIPPADL